MNKSSNIMKNEDGFVGLIALSLTFLFIYACLGILLLIIPDPLLNKSEIIYAETSAKIHPEYKDTLYTEFEEAHSIPFEDLIVTIVPASKTESEYFNEDKISVYPVADISPDTLSSLGLNKVLEEEYQSVAAKDLILILLSEIDLE